MSDMRELTIGQIVDLCISYNYRQKQAEKQEKGAGRRKASQRDIDAFFG